MTRRRRVVLVLFLGLVLIGGASTLFLWSTRPPPNAVLSRPTSVTVGAAPPPAALPLSGPEGTDAWGAPRRYVDQPGFRSLLLHKRYAQLDQYFEELQAAFEKDPLKEDWVLDAADAFGSAEPELQAPLDAWVAHSDTSYAALLARGTWWMAMGWAARGTAFFSQLSAAQVDELRRDVARATTDLERAIALRPTLLGARRELIKAASAVGDDELREKQFSRALEECPTSYRVRVTEIYALRPRWGGSFEQMTALAVAAPVEKNRKLKLLAGFADLERTALLTDTDLDAAARKIEEALRAGESSDFLAMRARIAHHQKRLDDAQRDYDRALELQPNAIEIRVRRSWVEVDRHAYEAAGLDLLAVLRVEPKNDDALAIWPNVVQGLTYTLDQDYQAHRVADAQRVVELAMELAASEKFVRHWVVWVANLAIGDAGVEELTQKAGAAPGDFRSHQLLDYRLSREHRYEEILAMWTAFLKENPEHGQALLERSGTNWQLHRAADALADAKAACELGVNAGCSAARDFAGPAGRK